MTKSRIDKLAAAQRQLDCAVRLFFKNEDSLAIHTLAFSAFRVLFDLSHPKPIASLVNKMGWATFSQIPNFLKHADKDPHSYLDEHTLEHTQVTLGLCILMYANMTHKKTCEMWAFDTFMKTLHPEEFQLEQDTDPGFEQLYRDGVKLINESDWEIKLTLGSALLTVCNEHPEYVKLSLRRKIAKE